MKKLNSLLLVTATLAGTLPVIVLSSCNKKKEVAKMEIDASEAYMDVFGQYTNEYATSGTAYIMGFKFKNCDINNIEASVEGLTGITATTTCEIVPNKLDPSYLNVYITFESEEIIYAKTATFSLVFTNKLDKENKVKIDGCSVKFVNKLINASISGNYFNFKFLNVPNEIDANNRLVVTDALGLPITDISDLIFEITPLGGASMKVAVTPDSTQEPNGHYRLKYKLTDVKLGSSSYVLTIKHKQLPNWFENFKINFKIEQTDKPFQYTLVDGDKLKITKLLVNDAEITIPDKDKINETEYPVEIIGGDAFPFQENLKKINIGNNVKQILSGAFHGCYNLVEVNIPKSVNLIYSNAFVRCEKLERLNVADDNPTYSNKTVAGGSEYAGCIWYVQNKELIASTINPIIPEAVTKIAYNGLVNNQLEEIVLPERITEIGSGCFAYSSKLKRVTLPATIEKVADGAFENCNQLETVTLSEGTKTIDSHAFYACNSLTNIVLPLSLTSINDGAFSQCHSLENITLPNNLKTIGSGAFNYCISLKELNIPTLVNNIPETITMFCNSLNKLTVDPENTVFTSKDGNTEVNCIININNKKVISGTKNSIIPNGIESIGERAFGGLLIEDINFPSTLKEIESQAFTESAIKTIDLSGCNSLSAIKPRVFQGAFLLTSIKLPDTISNIEWYAFDACVSLTELDLSNTTCTVVPKNMCQGCSSLETVKLPNTIKKIDKEAFYNCSSLKQIDLPSSITEIADLAFARCHLLQNITLPSSLLKIGDRAFMGTGLKSITIPASVTNLQTPFEQCKNLETIIVDDGNTVYSSKDTDGNQCNCIYTIETHTLDVGCKTTTIPKNIETIGEGAFVFVDSLTKITIPASVTCIEQAAFARCDGLELVIFENPNNWYVRSKPVEVDLSDPEMAAWFIYLHPNDKLTRQN